MVDASLYARNISNMHIQCRHLRRHHSSRLRICMMAVSMVSPSTSRAISGRCPLDHSCSRKRGATVLATTSADHRNGRKDRTRSNHCRIHRERA